MRLRWVVLALTLPLALAVPAPAQTNLQLWTNLTLDWVRSHRAGLRARRRAESAAVRPGRRSGLGQPRPDAKRGVRVEGLARPGGRNHGRLHETDRRCELVGGDAARGRALPPVLAEPANPGAGSADPEGVPAAPPRRAARSGPRRVAEPLLHRRRQRLVVDRPVQQPSRVPRADEQREADRRRVRYVLADWEWFIPLGEPDERFANKQRIRAGLGYRRSFAWRFEALYIWSRSRNTIEDGFTTNDNSIDVRVKRVF